MSFLSEIYSVLNGETASDAKNSYIIETTDPRSTVEEVRLYEPQRVSFTSSSNEDIIANAMVELAGTRWDQKTDAKVAQMAHPVEWKNRARELWELGWNPKRVIEKLDEEFKMAEQYGYLIKYTTLKSWARRGGWKHFSNADTPKHMNPNEPFGVSGISDPIYHLSLVMGKRLIREDSGTRSTDTKDDSDGGYRYNNPATALTGCNVAHCAQCPFHPAWNEVFCFLGRREIRQQYGHGVGNTENICKCPKTAVIGQLFNQGNGGNRQDQDSTRITNHPGHTRQKQVLEAGIGRLFLVLGYFKFFKIALDHLHGMTD